MCFYDQHRMACDCYKWGHFRQHCSKEYRTGETCGMKLVMGTHTVSEKCKTCKRIDTKLRSIRKEEDKIRRWKKEGNRSASIEKAYDNIEDLDKDLKDLEYERARRRGQTQY